MHTLTRNVIEKLHNAPCTPGMMLTCYCDLTVQGASERPGIGAVKHAASLIKQSIPENMPERNAFEKNYRSIVSMLESHEQIRSQGIAIFAAGQRNQYEVIPIGFPVRSELIYSQDPYLVPLLQAYFTQQQQSLVLVFDNDTARLYLADLAEIQLLKDWQSEVPAKQHSSGERGGWSQPGIAHRREEMLERFRKELLDELNRTLQAHPAADLILLSHEVEVNQLVNHLPPVLKERIVHTGTCAKLEAEIPLRTTIHEIVKKQITQHAQSLLAELKKRQDAKAGFAIGAADVLVALDSGKLNQKGCLLLGNDPKEDAYLCTSCRCLALEETKKCPKCGSAWKSCSLWEELLLRALRHNWNVVSMASSQLPSKAEGVALVFD